MKYHAYIEHYESVYDWTGEADSHEQAAAKAAEENEIPGEWTVVRGEPVQVRVSEIRQFVVMHGLPGEQK